MWHKDQQSDGCTAPSPNTQASEGLVTQMHDATIDDQGRDALTLVLSRMLSIARPQCNSAFCPMDQALSSEPSPVGFLMSVNIALSTLDSRRFMISGGTDAQIGLVLLLTWHCPTHSFGSWKERK